MTVFVVLYEDPYQKEGCENCGCEFAQEIEGVYSSHEEGVKAIKEYIARMGNVLEEKNFTIKEIVMDRRI